MSESWTAWCDGKFANLENGLYIVFRTTNNNDDPLYVLKHYKPDKENKLDIHNPITILQKDKHNNDYQSDLELGRGNDVGDTGFVKKDEEYIGIYNLPDNTKYNNRDSIKNKLDNESTINNFYEHGIYDWLIADAIMEHMYGEEVQETRDKSHMSDEIARLKAKQQKQMEEYQTRISYIFHLYSLFYGNYATWDAKYKLINDKVTALDKDLKLKILKELNYIMEREFNKSMAIPTEYEKYTKNHELIKEIEKPEEYIKYVLSTSIYDMIVEAEKINSEANGWYKKIEALASKEVPFTYDKKDRLDGITNGGVFDESNLKKTMENIKDIREIKNKLIEHYTQINKHTYTSVDNLNKELHEKNQTLNSKLAEIASKDEELSTKQFELDKLKKDLATSNRELDKKNEEITNNQKLLERNNLQIKNLSDNKKDTKSQDKTIQELEKKNLELDEKNKKLNADIKEIINNNSILQAEIQRQQIKYESLEQISNTDRVKFINTIRELDIFKKNDLTEIKNMLNNDSFQQDINNFLDSKLKERIEELKKNTKIGDSKVLENFKTTKEDTMHRDYLQNVKNRYYGYKDEGVTYTTFIMLHGSRYPGSTITYTTIPNLDTLSSEQKYLMEMNNKKTDETEYIDKNLPTVIQRLNSNLRHYLSFSPGSTVGDVNFESQWNNIFGLSNAKENKLKLLQFLFVDTLYQNWDEYKTWEQDFNKYSLQSIIQKYKNTWTINNTSILLKGLLDVMKIIVQEVGADESEKNPKISDKPIHIADLIEMYNYYRDQLAIKTENKENEERYVTVIRKVLINYLLSIQDNPWFNNERLYEEIDVLSVQTKTAINNLNDTKIITMVKINNYALTQDPTTNPNTWNGAYTPFYNANYIRLGVRNIKDGNDDTTNHNFLLEDYENNAFTFGGFSKVFRPNQPGADYKKTEDIDELMKSDQTKTIIDTIVNQKKNTFLFGYGASGAGKTAMLIYNNNKKTVGYCVELCKKICSQISTINPDGEKIDENETNILKNIKLDITGNGQTKINITELHIIYNDEQDDIINLNKIPDTIKPSKNSIVENIKIKIIIEGKKNETKIITFNNIKKGENSITSKIHRGHLYDFTLKFNYVPPIIYKAAIKVTFQEFSYDYPDGIRQGEFTFLYDNNSNDFTEPEDKLLNTYKYNQIIRRKQPPLLVFALKLFITNTGKDIYDPLTYGIRSIAPTRNNTESSRSHVVCSFQFIGGENNTKKGKETHYGKLDLADLAGVENKFSTEDPETIQLTYKNIDISNKWDKSFNDNIIDRIPYSKGLLGKLNQSLLKIAKSENLFTKYVKSSSTETIDLKPSEIINPEFNVKPLKSRINNNKPYSKDKSINEEEFFSAINNGELSKDYVIETLIDALNSEKHTSNRLFSDPPSNAKVNTNSLLGTQFDAFKDLLNITVDDELYYFFTPMSTIFSKVKGLTHYKNTNGKITGYKYTQTNGRNTYSFKMDTTRTYLLKGKLIEFKSNNGIKYLVDFNNDDSITYTKLTSTIAPIYIDLNNILDMNIDEKNLFDIDKLKNEIISSNLNESTESLGLNTKNSIEINSLLGFYNKLNENEYERMKYLIGYEDTIKENNARHDIQIKMSQVIRDIKIRTLEGVYINEQLERIRNDILNAVVQKSEGNLFVSPRIEPRCIDTMCDMSNDPNSLCYMMKTKSSGNTGANISNIIKYISPNETCNLKDLLIVVFTVFNISEKSDDGEIKYDKKNEEILKLKYSKEPNIFIDLRPLVQSYNQYKDAYNKSRNSVENFDDNNSHIKTLMKKLSTLLETLSNTQHESIKNMSSKNELIEHIKNAKITSKEKSYETLNGLMESIFTTINNHNATTPIGTLMFTNNIAHYGTNKPCEIGPLSSDDFATNDDDPSKYTFAIEMHNDTMQYHNTKIVKDMVSDIEKKI